MKKAFLGIVIVALLLVTLSLAAVPAFAAEDTTGQQAVAVAEEQQAQTAESQQDQTTAAKAWGAAIVVGLAAALGALGMGVAVAKAVDGIARQPEAEGKIRTTMMLGLIFIETAIIYALIIAILLIFVL